MSSRVAALTLMLFSATAAGAQDWGDFALQSDRSEDATLIEMMVAGDLSTALDICGGVARRNDVHVGAYVEAIVSSRTVGSSLRAEVLLRTLLEGLFDRGRASPALPVRVGANSDAIERLLASMSSWNDPQLVASLVRILPYAEALSRFTALMEVGSRIVKRLQATGGRLGAQETSLAMDYLGSVGAIGSTDFLEQCASVARLSTDADLVKAARNTASALRAPG